MENEIIKLPKDSPEVRHNLQLLDDGLPAIVAWMRGYLAEHPKKSAAEVLHRCPLTICGGTAMPRCMK